MRRLARRYARAAAELVDDASLEALAEALGGLAAALGSSPELGLVVAHPAYRARRGAVLAALLARLGGPAVGQRLLALLDQNGRLALLPDLAAVLGELADQRLGRRRVRVEVAAPLGDGQAEALARALGALAGGQVSLSVQVVPRLLGGWVCHLGDLTVDASLHRQLEVAAERLLAGRIR